MIGDPMYYWIAATAALALGYEAIKQRVHDYLDNRTLPHNWTHSGYSLTLRREGSYVVGDVNGTEMMRGWLGETPLTFRARESHRLRPMLERVSEARKALEDAGVSFGRDQLAAEAPPTGSGVFLRVQERAGGDQQATHRADGR